MSNADGNSVLLKSASRLKVDSHIKVVYLEYRDIRQSFFQVQISNIEVYRSSCLSNLSHYQRFCRRINHQHRSEIINRKRRSKLDEAMTSKDLDIFFKKRNLDKEIYSKIFGTPEHKATKARVKDKISQDNIRGSPIYYGFT